MNVYDMNMDSSGSWVRFFAKDNLTFPLNTWDEPAFFDAHPRVAIDRNTESTPRSSKARLADYSNVNHNVHPVFSERARRLLERHLDGLGRWIKLESDEAPYWLFWITNVVDALDEERSTFKYFNDGRVMRVVSFAFKPEAVRDQWLFTVPQRQGSHRLVTDRFIELVREHRLTGFSFEWLWSSEKGPRPMGLKDWEKPRITGLEFTNEP